MRAKEFILETMTFAAQEDWVDVIKPCWVCDSTGFEEFGDEKHPCAYCKGQKEYTDHEPPGPQLNLSNTNAQTIMSLLGYGDDWAYTIANKDLPVTRRKIIQLLNQEDKMQGAVRPYADTQKDFGMERGIDSETGLVQIKRHKGPRIIDMGIDVRYIEDKLKKLLAIIDYAQKKGTSISIA